MSEVFCILKVETLVSKPTWVGNMPESGLPYHWMLVHGASWVKSSLWTVPEIWLP